MQQTINTPETFDKITVGNDEPNSELDIVEGSVVDVLGKLILGADNGAEGTLNITDGSTVNVGEDVIISDAGGSEGTVNVSGSGSLLSTANDLFVGKSGTGTLNVVDGALVRGQKLFLGSIAGSQGTVTVSGTGSKLEIDNQVTVGETEKGTLNVLDGAQAFVGDDVLIGSSELAEGTVTVSGSGSLLEQGPLAEKLEVGRSGTGTLNILDGGAVSNNEEVQLGSFSGSSGTATISGEGSTLSAERFLTVGQLGEGEINLSNGGLVVMGGRLAEAEIRVAQFSGSTGTINIGSREGEAASGAGSFQAVDCGRPISFLEMVTASLSSIIRKRTTCLTKLFPASAQCHILQVSRA